MADAWETLVANSSLPSGDAWEHLNNQNGTGSGTVYVFGDPIEAIIDTMEMALSIDNIDLVIDIDTSELIMEIDDEVST